MACAITRSKTTRLLGTKEYTEAAEFPISKLPTNKNVIESMMHLLRPTRAGPTYLTKEQAAITLADT